jgi:hypothetical protein
MSAAKPQSSFKLEAGQCFNPECPDSKSPVFVSKVSAVYGVRNWESSEAFLNALNLV